MSKLTAGATHVEIKHLTRRQLLPGYPGLQVATSRSMHELLRPWRHFAFLVLALWLGGSIGVVALFLLLRRSIDRAAGALTALRRSDQKFAAAFRASPDGIVLTALESGRFIEVSDSVTRMTGYSREELLGPGMTTTSMWVDEADRSAYLDAIRSVGRVVDMEARFRIKSGAVRIGQMSGEIVTSGDETLIMGIIRDITAHKQREQLIWEQGNFDSLTGLPNRHMFCMRLEQLLQEAEPAGQPFVLLLIDLDQFKEVNDTLGHAVGDLLLVAVAERLRGAVAAEVTVARLGGDEFMVVLGDIHGLVDAQGPAAKLVESLSEPFFINDLTLRLSTSIGISIYPDDAESVDALINIADYALYEAKRAGKNRFCSPAANRQAAAKTSGAPVVAPVPELATPHR